MKTSNAVAMAVGFIEIRKVYQGADLYWPNAPMGFLFTGEFRKPFLEEKYLGTDGNVYTFREEDFTSGDHRRLILISTDVL